MKFCSHITNTSEGNIIAGWIMFTHEGRAAFLYQTRDGQGQWRTLIPEAVCSVWTGSGNTKIVLLKDGLWFWLNVKSTHIQLNLGRHYVSLKMYLLLHISRIEKIRCKRAG